MPLEAVSRCPRSGTLFRAYLSIQETTGFAPIKKHIYLAFRAICTTFAGKKSKEDEKDSVCMSREYMPEPDGGIRDERHGRESWTQ